MVRLVRKKPPLRRTALLQKAAKEAVEQKVPIKLVLDPTEETPTYHFNFAELVHGRGEIALLWTWIPPKASALTIEKAKETGKVVISPALQIVMAPHVAIGLRDSLTKRIELYEKEFGPVENVESQHKP